MWLKCCAERRRCENELSGIMLVLVGGSYSRLPKGSFAHLEQVHHPHGRGGEAIGDQNALDLRKVSLPKHVNIAGDHVDQDCAERSEAHF